MKYKIIQANSPQDLEAKVADLIKNGWVPCGGLALMSGSTVSLYAQAMVKGY